MKYIFIFSIISIVSTGIPSESDPRALQIAQDIVNGVAANILFNSPDGIASYFSEDVKFRICDGEELDRQGIVAKMLERRKNEFAELVFFVAKDVDEDTVYYKLEEHFRNQPILSTSYMAKKVNGKWVLTTGAVIKCNEFLYSI